MSFSLNDSSLAAQASEDRAKSYQQERCKIAILIKIFGIMGFHTISYLKFPLDNSEVTKTSWLCVGGWVY